MTDINTTGGTFKLSWTAPLTGDAVDHTTIYEHVGANYNVIQTEPQPNNITTLTGVTAGVHAYVAKFHNAAGDSATYSNEVSVTVIALPAAVQNLAFSIS